MRYTVLFYLILAGSLGSPSGAWAQPEEVSPPGPFEQTFSLLRDEGLSGSFRVDYFQSSKNLDDETDFLGGTVQVKM
ncbi:MAG TPA: hypothetical protein VI702_06990, partial [Nitrospiria bacterium]